MGFFWQKFFTQLSICVALCIVVADGMKTETITREFKSSVYIQDQTFLFSPGQVYGHCEDSLVTVSAENKFESSCKFAIENADVAIDSPDHVRVCDFTLTTDGPLSDEKYLLEEIIATTKDRAVVKFQGTTSYILWVLNFADCAVANSHISDKIMNVHASTYGKFDVISQKAQHPSEKYRTVFDADGNIMSDEQLWFEGDSSIISVVNSPVKGRLVIDMIPKNINDSASAVARVSTVDESGTYEILKEYPIDNVVDGTRSDRFVKSTTFDFVSLCSKLSEDESINCAQFDLGGNVKFENTISLRKYSPVHSMALHNLPQGGFLLFIRKCQNPEKHRCVFEEQTYHVKKIVSAGKPVATFKVNDNNSNSLIITPGKMHVFKSDKNGICLSNVRSKSNHWDLILDVVCLKGDDFSGEIDWPTY